MEGEAVAEAALATQAARPAARVSTVAGAVSDSAMMSGPGNRIFPKIGYMVFPCVIYTHTTGSDKHSSYIQK